MSFYRTYRPQSIPEIDNLAVRAILTRLLTKPKEDLPHAFFLSGPRGAGKTTAARVIAKIFNCENSLKNTGPCGTCEQCESISHGKNLDVLEMDAASNRGIDEIRSLRDAISQTPVSSQFRVYIIDEVHMLTTEAFNALLKTLEEPPAHAVFILATTDPQKVPVTIVSRTTPIPFSKATPDEIGAALKRIIQKENIAIDDEALTYIASHVDGSFRDAVKNLEQVSFSKDKVTVQKVQEILSAPDSEVVLAFITQLEAKNAQESIKIVESLVQNGKDMKSFIVESLNVLESRLIAGDPAVSPMMRKLTQAFIEIKTAPISQLPLELAVVEFCMIMPTVEPVQTVARMASNTDERLSNVQKSSDVSPVPPPVAPGTLTVEKLIEHWPDIIAALKVQNHSVAGVMRSTRPKSVTDGIVTIEAFFTFHKEKLSESKTKDILVEVFRRLFGEKVKVEIIIGKK